MIFLLCRTPIKQRQQQLPFLLLEHHLKVVSSRLTRCQILIYPSTFAFQPSYVCTVPYIGLAGGVEGAQRGALN
jgi:hypothetical protein